MGCAGCPGDLHRPRIRTGALAPQLPAALAPRYCLDTAPGHRPPVAACVQRPVNAKHRASAPPPPPPWPQVPLEVSSARELPGGGAAALATWLKSRLSSARSFRPLALLVCSSLVCSPPTPPQSLACCPATHVCPPQCLGALILGLSPGKASVYPEGAAGICTCHPVPWICPQHFPL